MWRIFLFKYCGYCSVFPDVWYFAVCVTVVANLSLRPYLFQMYVANVIRSSCPRVLYVPNYVRSLLKCF